ncbi:MAG: universal stress protein [Thermodesulfobacteriota bacterium]
MFQNILFPVDFSDNNRAVSPYALDMAATHGSLLHLLHVVRDLSHFAGFYVPHPNLESLIQDVARGARRKMDQFRQEHFAAARTTARVAVGDPAQEIVQYARENLIDLIIMGTHGRRGLEHAIFGSVAEKVVKNSPVPVLTVNPHRI